MKIIQYMLGFRNADGGVVRALIDLCVALAQRGHEVIALTTDDSDAPRNWDGESGRPKLKTLAFNKFLPIFISRAALQQAQQAFQNADVVHLHVPWDPICIQLARLARRMRIPYVVTVHGMLDDWTMAKSSAKKRGYLALAGRWLLEHAALVQSCAQIEMEQSSKWHPRGRSIVVPLLFDLNPFEQLPGPDLARKRFPELTQGEPIVLYLGRLHPIKRIEMLVDAMAQLNRSGVACRLVVAGTGDAEYEKTLRAYIKSQGLDDRTTAVGFVTGLQKLSLYQAADVAVFPSAHESFGYVTVEALACSTPVVTTKAVNIWPELQAGGGAIIVEQTSEALAGALAALLQDHSRRQQMARHGRDWVFQHFELHRVVSLYESMYRQAIAVNEPAQRSRGRTAQP